MTIYYLCHDVDRPSGGVRTIYRHVEALAQAGLSAAALHLSPAFRPWFDTRAPQAFLELGQAPGPDDHLAIPEDCPWGFELRHTVGAVGHVFAQSYYLLLGEHLSDDRTWTDWGVTRAFAASHTVAKMTAACLGVFPPVIPNAVDPSLFHPRPKHLEIAYMPRRLALEQGLIRRIVARRRPDLAAIPWRPVDGLSEAETAAALGRAAVFLALSLPCEGFGLPPLEAMASGCLVAGFHGRGGSDYARPNNGFWADDGDVAGAADQLIQALDCARANGGESGAVIAAARFTASGYSVEAQADAVVAYWRNALSASA